MAASKLQVSLNNIHSQMKMEIMSSLAKDIRVKALEGLVIKLGYDPRDIKGVEEMMKNKNVDIQALRKQLKLPTTKVPQTKEVGELLERSDSLPLRFFFQQE